MATDNQYVSKKTFAHIWQQIVNKFVKKETFNEKIEEIQDSIVGLANADEVYIMNENDTEEDIPENAVVVVYPNEDAEEIDWTNYYNKQEINEIITKAEFKRGDSAYQVAVKNGFEGDETEWVESLKGKSAYEIACELGFKGTLEEWAESLKGKDGHTPQKDVDYTDGYTPQRGVDYWTPSDVASIQTYVDILVAELVDSAPDELNTLWELANALGNDPNFATTVLNLIGNKADKTSLPKKLSDLDNDQQFMKKSEVEALIKTIVLDGYLGGKQLRYANDNGIDGYTTFKKG